MKQFINDHFSVIVVVLVFTMLFGSYMYQVHCNNDLNTGTIDWLEGEMKEVIGAILMGLTGGKVLQTVTQQGDTNASKPNEAVVPGTTLPIYPKS